MADHANRGVGWERVLDQWHVRYRAERRAVVWRTPPAVRLLSRVSTAGQFRACFRGEGPPDYAGVVAPDGRPVVFDAKDVARAARWPFENLERHQARDLEAVQIAGGLAFVALRIRGAGWVLPWQRLGPWWWEWHEREGRAARGRASIDPTEVDWSRRMPELGDWLGALA